MKTRHKIPAVFSIYMVDVLCCALGCVILLWQLYHHDSEEQTAKNEEIRAQLEQSDAKLEHSQKMLTGAEAMLAASVFHFGELSIADVKQELAAMGLEIRP